MIHQTLTSLRFIFFWVLGTLAAFFVTWIAAIFALALLSVALGIFLVTGGNPAGVLMQGFVIGVFGIIGAVMGFALSNIQKWVMHQKFQAEFRWWRRVSTVAASIGMVCTAFAMSVPIKTALITLTLPSERVLVFYGALPILLPLLCLGIGQWFILQRYVYGAWTWILAHVVAGLVCFVLLVGMVATHSILLLLPLVLIFAAPAIVTGFTMLWLFQFNARGTFPDEFY